MSRSSRRMRFSRRSLRSSSRSSVVSPFLCPASTSAWITERRRVLPGDPARSHWDRPAVRYSRMASARNSVGYRVPLAMWTPFQGPQPHCRVSTRTGSRPKRRCRQSGLAIPGRLHSRVPFGASKEEGGFMIGTNTGTVFLSLLGVALGLVLFLVLSLAVLKRWKFDPMLYWGTVGLLAWIGTWIWLWIDAASDWIVVYPPAAIGGGLGSLVICIFLGVYQSSSQDKLRDAFAAAYLLFYVALTIDLLVLSAFRASLLLQTAVATGDERAGAGGSLDPVVNNVLSKLGWVLITVVGFYFGADAYKSSRESKSKAQQEQAKAQQEVTVRTGPRAAGGGSRGQEEHDG